jgi:hypothetical protein
MSDPKEPTAKEWQLSRALHKELKELKLFSDQQLHVIKTALLEVLIANREAP